MEREEMTIIHSTNALPHGLHMMYQITDEAEAARIANGRTAYLYQSKIITAFYLFVPVVEAA
jgi:hypothetical protein